MTQQVYRRAITRTPPRSMANGITTQQERVDVDLAREQHQQYIRTLESLGVNVTVLDPAEDYPDSHFVEDAAIIHCGVAVMTRPGAVERRGEVALLKSSLQEFMEVVDLGGGDKALLDGGDVLFAGNHALIGISYRTNAAGAEQLKLALHKIDPSLSVHFVSFDGVLHLKSGMTALRNTIMLGHPKMTLASDLPVGQISWLPDEQGYAANTLTINGSTLYFAECESVADKIISAGLKPIPLNMSEFRKMDGSFTCLSLLW